MCELTWRRVQQTVDALANHLLDQEEGKYLSKAGSACAEVDTWIERLSAVPFPEFALPKEQAVRTELLVRLQYGSFIAGQNALRELPSPIRMEQSELLKLLLIERWHDFEKKA